MAKEPMRDPIRDHALTPENPALSVIDFRPIQASSIRSVDQHRIQANNIPHQRYASPIRFAALLPFLDGDRQ